MGKKVTFLFFYIFMSFNFFSMEVIKVVAAEQEPYVGNNLQGKGYVYEVVETAFRRAGYEAKIEFYPLRRAQQMVEKGEADAIISSYFAEENGKNMAFSLPFSGSTFILLKNKNLKMPLMDEKDYKDLGKLMEKLKNYKFGIVNGMEIPSEFDKIKFKEFVTKDLQNLYKLESKRVDFIVIDKYTASDILIKETPHLIGRLDFIKLPSMEKPFYVGFSKQSISYERELKKFNESLNKMSKDGSLKQIIEKHGFWLPKSKKKNVVTLRIGTVNNADMYILKKLSKEYKKIKPNVELEWYISDEEILRKRLLADMAISDGQFDIASIGAYELPIWAKKKWIVPFSSIPASYDFNDIIKSVRSTLFYDDKVYALPFYGESSALYYRKDILEKYGLRMPENPTYEDIIRIAKIVHNPEEKLYGIGLRGKPGWGANMATINTMVNSYGGQWFDINWKTKINSPEWKRALTDYKELITKYGPPNPTNNNFNELEKLFAEGKLAMWIDSTAASNVIFDSLKSKVCDETIMTNAPYGVTKTGSKWLWIWNFSVPYSSLNQKEAKEFILWATSKDYVNLVGKSEGWASIPPGTRVSTYENIKYEEVMPFSNFIFETIKSVDVKKNTLAPSPYEGIQYVAIPEFTSLGVKVGTNISKMIEGAISIEEALEISEKEVMDQMKKSGYIK